jgi:hypothetical protein
MPGCRSRSLSSSRSACACRRSAAVPAACESWASIPARSSHNRESLSFHRYNRFYLFRSLTDTPTRGRESPTRRRKRPLGTHGGLLSASCSDENSKWRIGDRVTEAHEMRIRKRRRSIPHYVFTGCPLTRHHTRRCLRICRPEAEGRASCGRIAPHSSKGRIQQAVSDYIARSEQSWESLPNPAWPSGSSRG